MIRKGRRGRFDSEGHQLIFELLSLLESGKPLSPASKKCWEVCLWGLSIADNKENSAEHFFRNLNLRYKPGHPHGETEARIYRIEWLIPEKDNKFDAFEEIAEEENREVGTIKNEYYKFRRNNPHDAERIRRYAEINRGKGRHVSDDLPNLLLFLAQCKQLELQSSLKLQTNE